MLILGVDPGTARLGWGVIKGETLVAYGCLETSPKLTEARRLEQLFSGLTKLLKRFKPDCLAIEQLFFFKNQTTVIQVSQARGVVLLAVSQQNLPVFSYTPLQVKVSLTGYGRADKHQVQQMVKAVLKLKSIPQPDDAADALAIALTHSFSHKFKSKVK